MKLYQFFIVFYYYYEKKNIQAQYVINRENVKYQKTQNICY